VLMETMFRATALESRFPLNMNVLNAEHTPLVMGLRQVLRAWLDHRHEVLIRSTNHRLAAIGRRLEILAGYLSVYLNLDEVIRIIRYEDEPKRELIARFALTENQAEAILNMRLRSLRRLEEIEIRKEHDELSQEQADLAALLAETGKRWQHIAAELKAIRAKFMGGLLGTRRTLIADVPAPIAIDATAHIEREAITTILSDKGWVRAVRGAVVDAAELKFKEGDKLRLLVPCETTDRLCLFATNGKFFTLNAFDLPRGRGDGQPVRLLADLSNEDDVVALFPWRENARYLVASTSGRGFLVSGDEILAEKRTGKQVLNLKPDEEAKICLPVSGDHVAITSKAGTLLIFPIEQIPEMTRGGGVILQKYKSGGLLDSEALCDVRIFNRAEGLSWKQGDRVRTETDLSTWIAARGSVGRKPPHGFPRSGKFGA